MAYEFAYLVTVSLERTEGKFATREELADQVREALADADPSSLDGDEGGSYDVQEWDVQEAPAADDFLRLAGVLEAAALLAQKHGATAMEARLRKTLAAFRITAPPPRVGPSRRERERAAQILRTGDHKARAKATAGQPAAVDGNCPECGTPLRDLGESPTAAPQHVGLCMADGHWWFTPPAADVAAPQAQSVGDSGYRSPYLKDA